MSSFTDNIQSITKFNPYVNQLPIEAMVEVGRIKQNQYDQGVQRIQSQIDNIAGLDVVRDVDKQYLQSKLNEIGGNLRKVAAGDFSNYQLVNSVGGMINKVGKDPNIQNAVSSTMRYKKGVADMEASKKDGKSSPSNEWDFMNQAQSWLSNPDIHASFSGSYNPYTNYKKNALEAIKALTKDQTITDDAFTIDSRGNLVIADATVRKKFAGISPDKIQQALMATLTPADFKQMEIDGRYNYSNVSPQRFVQDLNSSYGEKISFYNQQKRVLENAKSSTTSNLEKSKLNDQIESLDKVIRNISSEQRRMGSLISSGNIEAAKAQLNTNNFIDNFSKAFSYTETSQTYESSPFAQMAMQRATKEQDWKKFLLQMGWDREKFALEMDQRERLAKSKSKEEGKYGGLRIGIPQDQLPKYTVDKIVQDTEVTAQQVEAADELFIRQQGKDREWLEAQRTAWEKSPKGVDPKVANHFNSLEQVRRTVESNKTMVADITNEAYRQFGTIKDFIPNDAPTVYIAPNGQELSFTPEDFVNYNTNKDRYIKAGASGGTGGAASVFYDLEKAKQEMSSKEFYLFQIQSSKNRLNSGDKALLEKAQYYNKLVNLPYKETIRKINEFTTDQINNRVTVSQGVNYNFSTANAEERDKVAGKLLLFANLADSQGGKLADSPDFDSALAREIATDPNSKFTLTVSEGTQYQPSMYKMTATSNGKNLEFRITPEQKNDVFGDEFEAPPVIQAFRPYQEQIRKMGGYSTAFSSGTSNHNNAYLGKTDFPSVQIYGVKANIEQPSPGRYSIRISAFDPVKKQWYEDISYPRNQLVGENQVIPLMLGLNDAAVFELLNEKAPTAEDLKIVQQASKKPL